jgi:hypothetical protein
MLSDEVLQKLGTIQGHEKHIFTSPVSRDHSVKHIISMIEKLPDEGHVYFESAWLTDNALLQHIKTAQKRGVTVKVVVGNHHQNKKAFDFLAPGSVKVLTTHAKMVLISREDPTVDAEELQTYLEGCIENDQRIISFLGSQNPTETKLCEYTSCQTDCPQRFMELCACFQKNFEKGVSWGIANPPRPKALDKRIVLQKTPELVRKVVSTEDVLLGKSTARRILKPLPDDVKSENFYIMTMGFNNPDIVNAIIKKASNKKVTITLLVDKTAANSKKGKFNLDAVQKAGAFVHVYRKGTTQHTKSLIRIREHATTAEDDVFVQFGTANMTKEADDEYNYIEHRTGDSVLANEHINHFKKLVELSEVFDPKLELQKSAAKERIKKVLVETGKFNALCPFPGCARSFFCNTKKQYLKASVVRHLKNIHDQLPPQAKVLVATLAITNDK